MGIFRFLWLRRWIRKRTSPIPEERAGRWKTRLSIIYTVLAWNAFGFVCYNIFTGKADWMRYYGHRSEEEAKISSAQYWTKTLGIKEAQVYRVSGMKVQKYDIHNEPNADKNQPQAHEQS